MSLPFSLEVVMIGMGIACAILGIIVARLIMQRARQGKTLLQRLMANTIWVCGLVIAALLVVPSGSYLRRANATPPSAQTTVDQPFSPLRAPADMPCHVTRVSGAPRNQVDRDIAAGVAALDSHEMAQLDRAVDHFVAAFNQTTTGDPRRSAILDNIGCAYLAKSAVRLADPVSSTSSGAAAQPIPSPLPAAVQPHATRVTAQDCAVAQADQRVAARSLSSANSSLLGMLPGSNIRPTGELQACGTLKVRNTIDTYPQPSLPAAPIRGPPAHILTIRDSLGDFQVEELVWVFMKGELKGLIHIHEGKLTATLEIAVPECGTYSYQLEVVTYYDVYGDRSVEESGRTPRRGIALCDERFVSVVYCPYNHKLVWLE
jgi:hypothetical protein